MQLNVTRGSGLDNKEIHWSTNNVDKETTDAVGGYATLNLTIPETRGLSIGEHVLKASFDGDTDYTPSHATTTFQVQIAPTPTSSVSSSAAKENASVTLSVPSTAQPGDAILTGTFSGMSSTAAASTCWSDLPETTRGLCNRSRSFTPMVRTPTTCILINKGTATVSSLTS